METRVRERLVGALVLVAIVVLLVPAILKGRGGEPAGPPSQPVRRVEVPLREVPAPEEQVLVPEPVTDAPTIRSAPGSAAAAAVDRELRQAEQRSPEAISAVAPAPAPAPARPAPDPARPDPALQSPAWAVQLGAFSNRAKAQQLVAELRKRGYAAFLLEYRASGQVLYRVRVGPEQVRARAEEIAVRLAKDGFQPVVARHP
jgi:DedD protein